MFFYTRARFRYGGRFYAEAFVDPAVSAFDIHVMLCPSRSIALGKKLFLFPPQRRKTNVALSRFFSTTQ